MKVLIADRRESALRTKVAMVEKIGHSVTGVLSPKQLREIIRKEKYDLLLLATSLDSVKKEKEILPEIHTQCPDLAVVLIAPQTTVEEAVISMRQGAADYLQDPVPENQLALLMERMEREIRQKRKMADLENQISGSEPAIELQSAEPAVQEVYDKALQAAASEANVLLHGESGTGKTVLARQIHRNSLRAEHSFVTIHCPSLSAELLESELFGQVEGAFTGAVRDTWGKVTAAEEGTLFLDEIGELPLNIQSKLLRLLQERAYERVGETYTRHANVRIIAATNTDLLEQVENGKFREDLYYRLNVVNLRLPSLAERPADILPIAQAYLDFFASQMRRKNVHFNEAAREAMLHYKWPGNFRELRNLVERALIFSTGPEIEPKDFSENLASSDSGKAVSAGSPVTMETLEKEHIRRTLAREDSIAGAAEQLGIDTATLYRKRKRYGLDKEGNALPAEGNLPAGI